MAPPTPVVAFRDPTLTYPADAPYDPEGGFPEYPFPGACNPANRVYTAVRGLLAGLGLDEEHYGSPAWNPLGDLVSPGGTVLLKPNWVRHDHPTGQNLFSVVTHPAVLRPLIDFAYRAVGPGGRIYLMDAPLYDTDFAALEAALGLRKLESAMRARGVPLTIADLRSLVVATRHGIVVERRRRDDWACEGVEFDLGEDSELAALGPDANRIFGSDYDRRFTTRCHANGGVRPVHRYRIARRVLEAALVISVPKLKTHKKTGVTLNVKNMIGINTDKNYIPHFRVGPPAEGGDEYPDERSFAQRVRRRVVREAREHVLGRWGAAGERIAAAVAAGVLTAHPPAGEADEMDAVYETLQGCRYRSGNWWGNDTCWRSALDINKILLYGRSDGSMGDTPARRYLSVVDGVVGGDGPGPLAPSPRCEGVLIAGLDPLSVDDTATRIMGFDPATIRDQRRGWELARFPLAAGAPLARSPVVRSNVPEWNGGVRGGLGFRPHFAWREYLGRT